MSIKFEAPSQPNKYKYDSEPSDHVEPLADRVGEFIPETSAHFAAADALPSPEDLAARQSFQFSSEKERAEGLEAAAKAKRLLGFDK